jgi:outer membrane protein OmpA-like peptidoglycan-associated protein
MRRALMGALGLGLAWGCAGEEHARRQDAKEKGTKVTIVQTRTRGEDGAQSDQQRAQAERERAEQQRRREAEARLREASERESQARMRAELEAERAQRMRAERAVEADRAELAQLRAQQAQRELEQARQAQAQLRKELEEERQRTKSQAEALSEAQRARAESERARAEAEGARTQAEQSARGALEQVASVRQETRGLVVTLAAPVLFGVNDATLLPSAQERLDAIADALRASGSEMFRIEGHTDSRGSERYNLELSQRRAEAVRSFLVARGVNPDQIRAYGYGEQRPIATNATADGRANNRRVEIVLPNFGVGGAGGPRQGQDQRGEPPNQNETPAREPSS